MKKILVVHPGTGSSSERVRFLEREVEILRQGCGGDITRAEEILRAHDGRVDAIGLEGMPRRLRLAHATRVHPQGHALFECVRKTPVVDGGGVRAGLERWAIKLAERAQPGIFSQKRVLMLPGLQHVGMSDALGARAQSVRYADPAVFFGLPQILGIGARRTAASAAPATLNGLIETVRQAPWPAPAARVNGGALAKSCDWADILAGNGAMILHHGPRSLTGKTIVADSLSREEVDEFERRGASIVVTLLPPLDPEDEFARHSAVTLEALLAALRRDTLRPPDEDAYLDLMADLAWKPAIRYLDPEDAAIHRFAFVIHPLSVSFIHNDPMYRWTRFLPDGLVERFAARMPPTYISTITGGVSPTTGQRIEGTLYALGATPRVMMSRGERATYRQLIAAARMAERHGSRIMGLGAFTSVVGDAGITVDRETGIAITSGNSLTVAATLEAAKQAVRRMGIEDLTHGRVMIIGATGSIGAVCSRLLAQAIRDVVLVSIEPERLIELKRKIQQETPGARVAIATHSYDMLPECDLVVTTTSAFGKRVLDISRCKPGAVICDVARRAPPRRADRRERRGAHSRRHRLRVRHWSSAEGRVRLPRRDGTPRHGGTLRELHPGPSARDGQGEDDLPALQEAWLRAGRASIPRRNRHRRGLRQETRGGSPPRLRPGAAREDASRRRREAGAHSTRCKGRAHGEETRWQQPRVARHPVERHRASRTRGGDRLKPVPGVTGVSGVTSAAAPTPR